MTPDVIAVQFAWPTAIRGARGEPASATRPDEAIDALRANPGLSIVETSEAVMAGLAGSGLTLDHAVRSDDFSPVFDVAAGPISMGPGRRLWIGFFDVGTVLLAVLVGGSIARWAEAMTAAQPILASVTVGSDGGCLDLDRR